MTELEKVIDDLGRVMACGQTMLDCGTESPMVFKMIRDAADNAIAYLKSQEPMLVVNIHKAYNNVLNPDVPWVGKCPKCGKKVIGKNLTRFCMYCGQAVKWE